MRDKKFLSDFISILLEVLAWGLLIVVVFLSLLKWLGIISSPEATEMELSTAGIIFSWLFWLTKELFWFKSEVETKLELILARIEKRRAK